MKKKRILALVMAAVLCIAALAACGSSNSGNNTGNNTGDSGAGNSSSDNSGTNDTGSNTNDTGDGETSSSLEDTLGEVTAVNEDGSLELTLYSGGGTITDYAAVDLTAYSATTDTESVTIPDTATVYTAEDGTLTAAALTDIQVGDKVIISTDPTTSTITQVVIYPADSADSGSSDTAA